MNLPFEIFGSPIVVLTLACILLQYILYYTERDAGRSISFRRNRIVRQHRNIIYRTCTI